MTVGCLVSRGKQDSSCSQHAPAATGGRTSWLVPRYLRFQLLEKMEK